MPETNVSATGETKDTAKLRLATEISNFELGIFDVGRIDAVNSAKIEKFGDQWKASAKIVYNYFKFDS